MLIPVLLFIVGLLCLIKGGDWFVDGATGIARRFHVPELLIGATVVSIGTTLPEVMVSTTSALTGHGEIAYGNAIGSVICNAALIAAITIAVRPGKVDPKSLRTPVAFFFVAAAFYAGVAYTTGSFTRPVGLILLAIFVAYIVCNVLAMKNAPAPEEEEQAEEGSFAKELGLLAIGAVLIAVGADLLVDNGTLIAQALGVPESVIALTFVALGTSLPELVTAITSLAKGHGALSLGNVIGANVFNLASKNKLSKKVSRTSSRLCPSATRVQPFSSAMSFNAPRRIFAHIAHGFFSLRMLKTTSPISVLRTSKSISCSFANISIPLVSCSTMPRSSITAHKSYFFFEKS